MPYRQNRDLYDAEPQQPPRQNTQRYQQDQYYDAPQQPQRQNTQPYQNAQPYQQPQQQYPPSHDYEQTWDGKSYRERYAGSSAHVNPCEIQAFIPTMPYAPASSRTGMPFAQGTSGYSAVPEEMMKHLPVRQLELPQRSLFLNIQVPTKIVPVDKDGIEEFCEMRYTAVTCEPDDFAQSECSLRPVLYGRHTELFIVITMYNEKEVLFVKTMNAVIENVAHLCSRDRSTMWGPEGWKKVVVCIVSDGRSEVNKRTLQVLSLMGCYQDGIVEDTVGDKDVTAHIFEYTSSVVVTAAGELSFGKCPVQILFCLKEQNKKKLNSHRWFFNAFGPLIKPNVCILLDVGTKPTATSIYELWKCFDKHSNVGGACGQICVDTGRYCALLLTSPLAASQNFEYQMSNVLNKPFESAFGYISVLPGAFSAYRYRALLNGPDKQGPLASYFKGETTHTTGAGLFGRNMYLAEDRILCFEIVTKKGEGWILKYVKSAKASTDVPTDVAEFISQRRRWLNGSLFASIHVTVSWLRIWTSGQSFFRKISLQIEFIYNGIQLIFTWTSLANFYLTFFFLVGYNTADSPTNAFKFISANAGKEVFEVFVKLYIALLFVVVVCSLGNRPQGSKFIYITTIILFGLCNLITLWCAAYTVYLSVAAVTQEEWKQIGTLIKTNTTFRDITIPLMTTYGLYFISSFMHFEPWHMFTSFIQYMFFLSSYVNILMIYAMCNLHDVTWGTKGDNGALKELGSAKRTRGEGGNERVRVAIPRRDVAQLWNASHTALRIPPPKEKKHRNAGTKQMDLDRNRRTNFLLVWVGTNVLMILVLTSTAFNKFKYLQFLFFSLAGLSVVRFTGSFLYLVFELFGF
ncbi:chitin synthase 2 [Mycena galericulata]|nr:chitin synthase 2 [Mycena galericulata]